ncbi:MAG: hypothetical protein NTX86_03170, partial [Candidatus Dependentiae bacterium]|nr:hypothetical protein [Candidatus Dependentiae bacterium]
MKTMQNKALILTLIIACASPLGIFTPLSAWNPFSASDWEDVGEAIKGGFEDLGNTIKGGFEDFGKIMKDSFVSLGESIKSTALKAGTFFKETVYEEGLRDTIGKGFMSVFDCSQRSSAQAKTAITYIEDNSRIATGMYTNVLTRKEPANFCSSPGSSTEPTSI